MSERGNRHLHPVGDPQLPNDRLKQKARDLLKRIDPYIPQLGAFREIGTGVLKVAEAAVLEAEVVEYTPEGYKVIPAGKPNRQYLISAESVRMDEIDPLSGGTVRLSLTHHSEAPQHNRMTFTLSESVPVPDEHGESAGTAYSTCTLVRSEKYPGYMPRGTFGPALRLTAALTTGDRVPCIFEVPAMTFSLTMDDLRNNVAGMSATSPPFFDMGSRLMAETGLPL